MRWKQRPCWPLRLGRWCSGSSRQAAWPAPMLPPQSLCSRSLCGSQTATSQQQQEQQEQPQQAEPGLQPCRAPSGCSSCCYPCRWGMQAPWLAQLTWQRLTWPACATSASIACCQPAAVGAAAGGRVQTRRHCAGSSRLPHQLQGMTASLQQAWFSLPAPPLCTCCSGYCCGCQQQASCCPAAVEAAAAAARAGAAQAGQPSGSAAQQEKLRALMPSLTRCWRHAAGRCSRGPVLRWLRQRVRLGAWGLPASAEPPSWFAG